MAESFTPINTQEEFDNAIKPRLAREKESLTKQFESQIGDLNSQIETLTKEKAAFEKSVKENTDKITNLQTQLEGANSKAAGFELEIMKTEVAMDKGLPMELRSRLTGTTKEELEKDADSLSELMKQQNRAGLPGFQPQDDSDQKSEDAVYKELAKKLRKGE